MEISKTLKDVSALIGIFLGLMLIIYPEKTPSEVVSIVGFFILIDAITYIIIKLIKIHKEK